MLIPSFVLRALSSLFAWVESWLSMSIFIASKHDIRLLIHSVDVVLCSFDFLVSALLACYLCDLTLITVHLHSNRVFPHFAPFI